MTFPLIYHNEIINLLAYLNSAVYIWLGIFLLLVDKVQTTFIVEGLPSQKTTWKIVVGGKEYSFKGNRVLKISSRSTDERWQISTVFYNGSEYAPYPFQGNLTGGEIKVKFIPIIESKQTLTIPKDYHKLSISVWNPEIWKGKNIGIYKVIDVLGEGATHMCSKWCIKIRLWL